MSAVLELLEKGKSANQLEKFLQTHEETNEKLDELIDSDSRLDLMSTVNSLAEVVVDYGIELKSIFNKIATGIEYLPLEQDELQAADRNMMLEYLDLIETNTRNYEDIIELMEDQYEVLDRMLENSDKEREDKAKEASSSVKDLVPIEDQKDIPEGGISGVFSSLGSFLGGFGKMGKMLMRFGGPIAAVAAAGFFVNDLMNAFGDTKRLSEISGVAEDAMTGAQKSAAAFASSLEKFTFGFLDAKSIYGFTESAFEVLSNLMDNLFDPDDGLFGIQVNTLFNVVSKLIDGDFMGAMKAFADGVGRVFTEFPQRIVKKIGEWYSYLFSLIDPALDIARDLFGKEFVDPIVGVVEFVVDKIGDIAGSVKSSLSSLPLVGRFFGSDEEPMSEPSVQPTAPRAEKATAVNRKTRTETAKLSKERFDKQEEIRVQKENQPVITNVTNNNVNPIIKENSLSRQIQLLGI